MIPLISDPESLTPVADASRSPFRLLADRRRRAALRYLDRHESARPVSVSDVASHVIYEERHPGAAADHGSVSAADRRSVELSLRHTHLPMLADAGAVEYDPRERTVSLTDEGRTLLARSSAIRGSFE